MLLKQYSLPFLFDRVLKKVTNYIHYLLFVLIKKHWYKFCYNSNGNKFDCKGVLTRSYVLLSGEGNSITIAKGANLNNVRIDISGNDNHLVIKEGVSFSEGGWVRIQDKGNKIIIGKNTKIINTFFSLADINTNIIVGEDCLFSDDIIVRSSDSHSIFNSDGKRINKGESVYIGNHVWVCNGVRIMKGSCIGDNCVIGSNALVSGQHFDKNVLVAGSPSKILKQGINWSYERLN